MDLAKIWPQFSPPNYFYHYAYPCHQYIKRIFTKFTRTSSVSEHSDNFAEMS